MKIKTFSIMIVCALLICSCNTKKATKGVSPYLTEENSKTEITVRTEKVKPVDQTDKTLFGFYVIIGSFRNIENARQYRADLVKEGFTPVVLENEDGLFRISAGGYNEESAARTKIAGIRAAYENHKDVWLLVRK
ncbi:MAG: SPOR domain-containing protein [Bacteroidales bacterium]|jgi:cell division protein FtsN|nr:SPOR domain-containing protein [Bacteroidales bacterium]